MSLYRITPGSKASGGSGPPLASDVNQIAKILDGTQDAGALQLAPPVVAPASAPTASTTAGTTLGVGTYVYAVSYVTGHLRDDGTIVVSGETIASPTVNVTTTTGFQSVSLTSLPVSAATTVIGKRVYRTLVGGAQRKLVATIAAGLTSYIDTTTDVSLGANEPTINTTGTKFAFPTPATTTDPATKGYTDATFIQLGTTNQNVQLVQAILQPSDTRSTTYAYTNGNVTGVTIKDGAATVKTITFAYLANGNVNTVTEVVGGKTITTTYAYNADGTISGETRGVV